MSTYLFKIQKKTHNIIEYFNFVYEKKKFSMITASQEIP